MSRVSIRAQIGLISGLMLVGLRAMAALTPEFAASLSTAERAWAERNPEVLVSMDPDSLPTSKVRADGEVVGLDVDLLRAMERRTGLVFRIVVSTSWAEAEQRVKSGEVDLLTCVGDIPERREWMTFTRPYFSTPVVIVSRDDESFHLGFSDLKRLRVVMPDGYTVTRRLASDMPDLKFAVLPSGEACELAVSAGSYDATLVYMGNASYEIGSLGLSNLKIAGTTPYTFNGCIGVRRDKPLLAAIVGKALDAVPPDEFSEISGRWIAPELRVSETGSRLWLPLLWGVVALAASVAGLMFLIRRIMVAMVRSGAQLAEREARLREANSRLESANDRLSEFNSKLEEQVLVRTEALERLSHELEVFTYTVSHDLRAPLRTVDSFAAIFAEEHTEELPPEDRVLIEDIRSRVKSMRDLIDGILKLSRVGREPLNPELVDLASIAREEAAALVASSPGRVCEWVIRREVLVHADAAMMRLVLANLFSNAWKHTAAQSRARSEFGETVAADGSRLFFVKDNGDGFESGRAELLFRPFAHGQNASGAGGRGMGLAMCQRVIRRHGGIIEAEGRSAEGATFVFTLGDVETGTSSVFNYK